MDYSLEALRKNNSLTRNVQKEIEVRDSTVNNAYLHCIEGCDAHEQNYYLVRPQKGVTFDFINDIYNAWLKIPPPTLIINQAVERSCHTMMQK